MSNEKKKPSSFDKFRFPWSKGTIKQLTRQSMSWFNSEVNRLRRIPFNKRHFIMSDSDAIVKRLYIGKMYMFQYSPKHMETLPIWDEYPLVLPFTSTPTGFIGINFHYLPHKARAWLLERLMQVSGEDDNKRMRVSWEILSHISKVDIIGSMATHQYLLDHIVSPIREVKKEDYATAIMLPLQKWHGENKNMMKGM